MMDICDEIVDNEDDDNNEKTRSCTPTGIASADSINLLEREQTDLDESEIPAKRRKPRQRKCKNRLTQLSDKFPGISFSLIGVYGPPDNQKYVMDVSVEGQSFQGVGQSKIKAKIMAAEFALMHYGIISELSEPVPPITPDCFEDYTADISETPQFYDFNSSYLLDDEYYVPWFLPQKFEPDLPVSHEDVSSKPDENSDIPPMFDIDDDDFRSRLLGKTPLTIVGELQLGAFYSLIDETGDQLHPMFAMSVTINDETFYGAGTSKKLAKARAARNALQKLYNIEFNVTENGMPIYEGDDRIWQECRKKLRKEALSQLQPGRNPLIAIAEYCPCAKYEVEAESDDSHLFTARLTVMDKTYTSVGTTKTDAKTNVATNALEELRKDKNFAIRQKQSIARRREQRACRQGDPKPLTGSPKNAVAKLNLLYRGGVEFHDIAETPVPHTAFTAFTVAVGVDGRYFVGVGKTKKQARLDAAERALKVFGFWTAEDESVKWDAAGESNEDPVEAVQRMRERAARERANAAGAWDRSGNCGWRQHGARDWNGGQSGWEADFRDCGDKPHNFGWGRGRGNRNFEDWNESGWNSRRHGEPPGAWGGQYSNTEMRIPQGETNKSRNHDGNSYRSFSEKLQPSGWQNQGIGHGHAAKVNKSDVGLHTDRFDAGSWQPHSFENKEQSSGRQLTRGLNENVPSAVDTSGFGVGFNPGNGQHSSMISTYLPQSFTPSITTGFGSEQNYFPFPLASGLSQQTNTDFSFREGYSVATGAVASALSTNASISNSTEISGYYGTSYGNMYGGQNAFGNGSY